MKKVILSIPFVIYIILIVVSSIPHGFSIMYEPSHPWYTPYTSVTFLAVAMWFLPVTALSSFYELEVIGLNYFIVAGIYTLFLSAMFFGMYNYFRKKFSK
tara:strand:- start:386 stop:685 length:300 start_codon:yes stop_codon:yes gene_type:complete